MNVGNRAALYLLRKKGKCLSLLLLLVLISSFVMTGFTILTGTQAAAKTLRETVGASFGVRGGIQGGEIGDTDTGYQLETAPLPDELVERILQVEGIKAYNTATSLPGSSADFFFPSGAPAGQLLANSSSEWNRDFVSGLYILSEGSHIAPEDSSVAIVSRRLAQENGLHLGDTVTLTCDGVSAAVQLIGLYDIDEAQEPSEDTLFIDHHTAAQLAADGRSRQWYDNAVFYVTDPAELPGIVEQVKAADGFEPELYALSAQTSEYDNVSAKLATVVKLTALLIAAAALVSAIILILTLTMRIRNRMHEAGILLSVGVPKHEIVGQFLLEAVTLALIAFVFSYPIGSLAAGWVGTNLLGGLSGVTLSLSAGRVAVQYALELAAVIATVLIASLSVIRLKPKDILSKMS